MRRHLGLLAVLALGLAYAWPFQGAGFNQNSHYVLVKALADGTAVVDETLREVGDLSTQDVTRVRGRLYSNKAPGLAAVTLAPFLVLEAAGARTTGDPTRMLWGLGLFGAVLPATALLLLVRSVVDRIEPGFGTAAAIALGLGTLLLLFATLFFAHALSAFLVFAAFALLFAERRKPARTPLVFAAGVVAGLAVTTEYPGSFAAAVLGLYAVARPSPVERGLAYALGVAAGLVPLALYNRWAFGSFTHLSYLGEGGGAGLEEAPPPSFDPLVLLETLFGRVGLVTLAPVLASAAVGVVLLYRRGFRAEALAVAGISALYLVYNASYGSNFGGLGPGQRYVIPILPLLALGLGPAFRAIPVTTCALALVSAAIAIATTATGALAGYDARWLDRVADLQFTLTPLSLVDVTGWYTILPFVVLVGAAAVGAFLATPWPPPQPGDTLAAGAAVLAWALVAANAPASPVLGGDADELASYAAVGAVALAALGALLVARARRYAGSSS